MTKQQLAERQWSRYGRIRGNSIYLAGYYIGRIGADDAGQPFTFCKGDRAVGFVGIQPVAVVSRYLESSDL